MEVIAIKLKKKSDTVYQSLRSSMNANNSLCNETPTPPSVRDMNAYEILNIALGLCS